MRRFIVVMLIILAGCHSKQNQDTSVFYEDGRKKPVAIVAPIIDSTSFDYSWSLSDEFFTYISQNLTQKGICITSENVQDLSYQQNPFENDLSWIKNTFQNSDFVIFIEFVEHKQNPVYKRFDNPLEFKDRSQTLDSIVRIKVVDIRQEQPKIILQESLKDSYFISKNLLQPDYDVYTWGTKEFNTSPVGIAHNQLAKIISERISDYLIIAKSR
jgi:hypothetical protein